MEYLENNMDDLFRAAAENYRLKDPGDHWDSIAQRINAPAPVSSGMNSWWKKFIILSTLILLLLVAGAVYFKYTNTAENNLTDTTTSVNKKAHGTKNNSTGNTGNAFLVDTGKSSTSISENTQSQQISGSLPEHNFNIVTAPGDKDKSEKIDAIIGSNIQHTKNHSRKETVSQVVIQAEITEINPENKSNRILKAEDHTASSKKISDSNKNVIAGNEQQKIKSIYHGTGDTSTSVVIKDDVAKRTTDTSAKEKSLTKNSVSSKKIRSGKFYFGITGGPEWNEVSRQGYGKPGYHIGVITGYKLSSKAAVELGLLLAKKLYFTDGEHFNMKMPGSEIKRVDGSSVLIEVPLHFKYEIFKRQSSGIYLSSGLSSYFLTNEENDYILLVNGGQTTMTSIYKNASRYIAGAVDFGAGYSFTKNKITYRLQPYLQVPVKGIGVGTLRVMTTGINVAILY